MDPEFQESSAGPKKVLLTKRVTELLPGYHKQISVDGNNIGASLWKEMIEKTQSDKKEQGIIIATDSAGNLKKSAIFEGTEETMGKSAEIKTRLAPFGLRNIFSRSKHVVHVHTHPMSDELNHLKTTVISDMDIEAFCNSDYAAMVMLDRGGAHLLVNTERYNRIHPPENLVRTYVSEASGQNQTMMDVMRRLAKKLPEYGLAYYYTSSLEMETDNTITFNTPA